MTIYGEVFIDFSSLHDSDLVSVTEEGDEIRHAWYQWVVFVLFFQVLSLSHVQAACICLDHTKLISIGCYCLIFSLFDYTIELNTDPGYSLLYSSLSVEELGGWKTFLASSGDH